MGNDELIEQLKKVLGEKLKSVVAYGSTVRGDTAQHSDTNILIVATDLSAQTLLALQPLAAKWMKRQRVLPVFFTPDQIAHSLDVFPIEFTDMKRNNQILFGEDSFAGVEIATRQLRWQLEYELRVKLIQLRRAFLEIGDRAASLEPVTARTVSSLTALFRALLTLANKPVPSLQADVWNSVRALVSIDVDLVRDVRERKQTEKHFERLVGTLETVIRFVDEFK